MVEALMWIFILGWCVPMMLMFFIFTIVLVTGPLGIVALYLKRGLNWIRLKAMG